METNGNWVDITVGRGPIRGEVRNRVGLVLKIKARPDVEEFLSNLAEGRRLLVEAATDSWINCKPETGALEYYDAAVQPGRSYTFNGIGQGLIIAEDPRHRLAGSGDDKINLSFLLLAGISNPDGKAVGLSGAYSSDYVNKVKMLLPTAIKQFLLDYLVPMTVNLQITTNTKI